MRWLRSLSRIPPGHIGEVLQAHPVGGGPRSDAAGMGMSQCLPRRAEGGAEEEVVRNK